MLGKPRAGRLGADEGVGALRLVAHGNVAIQIDVGRFANGFDKIATRNLPQDFPSFVGLPHITLDDAAISLADFGNRLTTTKVNDVIRFQRFVGLTPTQHRQVYHSRPLGLALDISHSS